jgi:hypothetical protein
MRLRFVIGFAAVVAIAVGSVDELSSAAAFFQVEAKQGLSRAELGLIARSLLREAILDDAPGRQR